MYIKLFRVIFKQIVKLINSSSCNYCPNILKTQLTAHNLNYKHSTKYDFVVFNGQLTINIQLEERNY